MRRNYVSKLYDDLLNDEKYKQYCKIYKQKHYIDLELLKYLFKEHHEIYYVFLKINLLLYFDRESKFMNKFNNDLQDYYHINKSKLQIEDLELILRHYYKNYHRCRQGIVKILDNKLVSDMEKHLLELIFAREVIEMLRFISKEDVK